MSAEDEAALRIVKLATELERVAQRIRLGGQDITDTCLIAVEIIKEITTTNERLRAAEAQQ